jgi:NAD(P)H-hydrate epimerase
MQGLPTALYRADQVRELDRIVTQDFGVPGFELMSRAGRVAYTSMRHHWPRARRLCVFAGVGNNAGDGYVLAKLALQDHLSVTVIQISSPAQLDGDAKQAYSEYLDCGGKVETLGPEALLEHRYDIAVDAILGTGLRREVEGEFRSVIEFLNAGSAPVLSLDIPSGLNPDTGQAMGIAVRADLTVSFIGLKQGMVTGFGPDYCGEIEFNSLDIPNEAHFNVRPEVVRIMPNVIDSLLPPRTPSMHKGDCGHVLVVGGAPGYAGAAGMCGVAALRTGAGLVSVATHETHASQLMLMQPEMMSHAVADGTQLEPFKEHASVIAVGPGLGQSEWAEKLMQYVLSAELPLVVDADGLNLLARDPQERGLWILTPHPGEAARLLGTDATSVQNDRFAAIEKLADEFNAVVVLKGAGTLVRAPNTKTFICTEGNPGMATAGMGDVLTGVIASLVAQGLDLLDAARLGVYIHAKAGDRVALSGMRGMLATDLMTEVRNIVNSR